MFRSKSILLRRFAWVLFLAITALLTVALQTDAQIRSNIAGVNLAAIMRDSISVSAAPGLVNFALVGSGVSIGSPTLTINTSWVLRRRETITTYAYFSSSTAALTDGGGHNIPSSSVSGSVNGGAFQTFTGRCPFSANTCVQVFTQRVRRGRRGTGLRGTNNSSLQLRISTVGLALPPGTYTGVLHIQAEAL